MKMERPEVDVVRFKESDVIVASGPIPPMPVQTLDVRGVNDSTANNITLDGVSVDTYEKLAEKLGGQSNSYFQHNGNRVVHESELFAVEDLGILADGIYTQNGTYNDSTHGVGPLWHHNQ